MNVSMNPPELSGDAAASKPAQDVAAQQEKSYIVPMFPYPSGTLHIGHARVYAIADAMARIERMRGKKVLFPIGWDAFGLPAENAAIEKGVAPSEWTRANIATMKKSLEKMDFSFDWSREIAACDPETYRFSQLFFVKMRERGIIYRSEAAVQWDPVEKTVLAREQVIGGKGWRSGATVEERIVPSWTARITAYADELLAGYDALDWPEPAKAIGRAWIGKEADGSLRLHDWNLSRQRYWGCPVPIIECADCGEVSVPESDLPVVLPEGVRLSAPGNPLAQMNEWRACFCPRCGKGAQRSIETLDTFFDSSWYFLRYPSVGEPGSETRPMVESASDWASVDHYVGGIEHASMHLIYARFFCMALNDMGFKAPREPFKKFTAQGFVCAPIYLAKAPQGERFVAPGEIEEQEGRLVEKATGFAVREGGVEKMSKSKKNGQSIESILCAGHSADSIRLALFFAGPFAQNINWTDNALAASEKALYRLREACKQAVQAPGGADRAVEEAAREFVKKARDEIEQARSLNVTIGAGLGALRAVEKALREGRGGQSARRALMAICVAFFPIAPRTAMEAGREIEPSWSPEKNGFSAFEAFRPTVKKIALQANGRFLEAMDAPEFSTQNEAVEWAIANSPEFAKKIDPSQIESIHWRPGRVLNVVGRFAGPGVGALAPIVEKKKAAEAHGEDRPRPKPPAA